MRYKMQSLDSYSGTVGRNYHLQHIMHKCPGSPMATGTQASFSTLRAYAAYSTHLEMTWLS